ncbi:hypothetical protein HR060_03960 [Catenovulum sp. SM1970]|uniref:hypothetical protein n=1 Tax=Marinifaba aquimaris TaxID=2741323 RepID=UPI0015719EAC|nr:hypothetical protein [Marinifaba aquimaris]NTS76014.1 hypothetical protein [Marinifaba aquimaris]
MAKEISKWLDSLDPDEVAVKAKESIKNLPKYHWKNDEWEIDIKAIPRKKEKRLSGKKAIGIEGNGAEYVNEWEPLKNAICKKGNRYGRLNKPLVVAVNMDTHALDPIDEM